MATVARGNRNITKVHHRCMIDRLPAYSQPFAAARPLNTGKHAIGDTPHRAAADDRITKRIKPKKKKYNGNTVCLRMISTVQSSDQTDLARFILLYYVP